VQGVLNDLWKFTTTANQWTWVSGSSSTGQLGVYGTLDTPSASNVPGARTGAVGWTDKDDNLWLVGGNGEDSAGLQGDLNDVWEFSPANGEWVPPLMCRGHLNGIPARSEGTSRTIGTR
jgi:N-acetylneuraminic acid mutarotase